MGVYLSKAHDIAEIDVIDGSDGRRIAAVGSMQGWRKNMEDSHITVPNIAR